MLKALFHVYIVKLNLVFMSGVHFMCASNIVIAMVFSFYFKNRVRLTFLKWLFTYNYFFSLYLNL